MWRKYCLHFDFRHVGMLFVMICKFRLSIVIEYVVATCMYVTMTYCAPSIGRYKLNDVVAGFQTFLMARYNYMVL